MKKLFFATVVLIAVLVFSSIKANASDVILTGIDGKTVNLSDYKNHLVIVNIVQARCVYCNLAANTFSELYDNPSLRKWYKFVAVDPFDNLQAIKQLKDALNLPFPIYSCNLDQVRNVFHDLYTPSSVVLLNGKVIKVFVNPTENITDSLLSIINIARKTNSATAVS